MSEVRFKFGLESGVGTKSGMVKEDLLKYIKKALDTDADLDFLMRLDAQELTTLLVCIRDKLNEEERRY